MTEKLGQLAGNLWRTLGTRGRVEMSRLPKLVKNESVYVYQALGWLARENKIKYEVEGNKTYVLLADQEAEIFRNSSPSLQA